MNPKENDSDFCQPKTNKNTLDESNQETISGQPELFAELLSMFDDIPFNNFIVEGTWIQSRQRGDFQHVLFRKEFHNRHVVENSRYLFVC